MKIFAVLPGATTLKNKSRKHHLKTEDNQQIFVNKNNNDNANLPLESTMGFSQCVSSIWFYNTFRIGNEFTHMH